jgi:hypothetical protein
MALTVEAMEFEGLALRRGAGKLSYAYARETLIPDPLIPYQMILLGRSDPAPIFSLPQRAGHTGDAALSASGVTRSIRPLSVLTL